MLTIGFFNIDDSVESKEDFNYVEIRELEVKNVLGVDVLVAGVESEDDLEKVYKSLTFAPEVVFIPYIKTKNFSLVSKCMSIGAKTFFFPPFKENFPRVLQYVKSIEKDEEKIDVDENFCGIVGKSPKMVEVFDTIKRTAPTDSVVLITGESGTGKELVARAIHIMSRRRDKLFLPVNCGAIPKDLIESELFGYRKGAFTGANANKPGKFEIANGGTIFLDEIGELSLELQVKLLRVLQESEIQPIGATTPVKIDVRIVAATNKDLEKLVEENKFREDLFYRLNVIQIHLPPLRERKEDIELLIDHFFKKFTEKHGKSDKILGVSDEAKFIMKNYHWPGNVRELENLMERLVVLKNEGYILPSDLPPKFYSGFGEVETQENEREFMNNLFKLTDEGLNLKELIDNIETTLILQALEKAGGVKDKAAKLLNIKRTTLIEKMKRKNLM